MFKNIIYNMEKVFKKLACEVRGVDLKTENRPEGNIVFNLGFFII